MAGIEIRGFEQLRANLAKVSTAIADTAAMEAELAAAQVLKAAMEGSAPKAKPKQFFQSLPAHPAGNLAKSIIIHKSKARRDPGTSLRRILVGPSREGFYGYFYEKGRKGFAVRAKKAKALHWSGDKEEGFARRVTIGPQYARNWLKAVAATTEEAAYQAGLRKFEEISNRLLEGLKP